MSSPAYTDYLKTINQTLYDQIKTADQKAAYIFTFLIALLVWSTEVRKVFLWMDTTEWFTPVWAISILLVTSLTFATVCASLVLLPRNRKGGVPRYWGAWHAAGACLPPAFRTEYHDFIAGADEENDRHPPEQQRCRRGKR